MKPPTKFERFAEVALFASSTCFSLVALPFMFIAAPLMHAGERLSETADTYRQRRRLYQAQRLARAKIVQANQNIQ